jgi:hypothetical protein
MATDWKNLKGLQLKHKLLESIRVTASRLTDEMDWLISTRVEFTHHQC